MIFENNDHNVTLVEFFIFVMHICCHVINRKKLNASPPGTRDGGKDGKMEQGSPVPTHGALLCVTWSVQFVTVPTKDKLLI